jgi:hypothetical protein
MKDGIGGGNDRHNRPWYVVLSGCRIPLDPPGGSLDIIAPTQVSNT